MTRASGRIVVGVDGSAASIDALCWAARQAQLTGAALEVVTAWSYPIAHAFPVISSIDWKENTCRLVDQAVDAAIGKESDAVRHVLEGHAAQVLTEAAVGADLLVVGSRGHGGFRELLLGSVSEHVVRHAPCPVVVVRRSSTSEGSER